MSEILHNNKALEQACKEFDVKELYVFGSYISGNLSEDSDLDFLVDFNTSAKIGAFEQFMGFIERLEEIFNRSVDLLTVKKFRNPIFEKEVNQSKSLIYAT